MKLFFFKRSDDTEPSDGKQLAAAAQKGDPYATRQLLERVAPKVVRSVQMVLGYRSPDVDDCAQHALIQLVQSLPSFRGECEPEWYAARIAVRMAVAERKKHRFRAQHYDDGADLDEQRAHAGSPEDDVRAARRQACVRALLDDLPEEQAEALALRFMLGLSLEEVAEASGVPVNTVRSRVRLAKVAIKARIERAPELAEALELEP
jgi:RNA polymerase sigma-70 factor (ECF subfamily)